MGHLPAAASTPRLAWLFRGGEQTFVADIAPWAKFAPGRGCRSGALSVHREAEVEVPEPSVLPALTGGDGCEAPVQPARLEEVPFCQ